LSHGSKDLCRSLRSLVFRFISGVLRVIHRGVRAGKQGSTALEGRGESTDSLVSGWYGHTETAVSTSDGGGRAPPDSTTRCPLPAPRTWSSHRRVLPRLGRSRFSPPASPAGWQRLGQVGRHSYPDTGDARTFRDLPLRLVQQAGPYPLPPEARQHVEVLDLRDALSPKRRVGRGPYNCYVPGEVSSNKGDEGRTSPPLLLRKVARILRAGLVPSRAAEGCRDQVHVAAFERAYREVFHIGGAGHMAGRSRSDGSLRRRR
jgi:hypothetical protein